LAADATDPTTPGDPAATEPDANSSAEPPAPQHKATPQFLRRFRISTRIWALVGVAAAGIVALGAGAGMAGWVLDQAAERQSVYSDLMTLNDRLRAETLQIRRHEKDFLLRS